VTYLVALAWVMSALSLTGFIGNLKSNPDKSALEQSESQTAWLFLFAFSIAGLIARYLL